MRNFMQRMVFFCVAFAVGWAGAAPITAVQAKKAVAKWVTSRPAAHMQAKFASADGTVETARNAGGTNLFHLVRLEGGGFVVTSTDDGVQPVIAFSDSGNFELNDGSPMWELLTRDLAGRLAAVGQMRPGGARASLQSVVPMAVESDAGARDAWADLLEDESPVAQLQAVASPAGGLETDINPTGGRGSVTDVRVSPLVQSKWSQSRAGSGNCYNYYTPNNYVCGCVATAGAQLLRYHRYPTQAIVAGTYSCWVDDVETAKTMMGGTYNWDAMPLVPASTSLTTAQRQAIGKLCYDVGVAARMNWGFNGSGASSPVLGMAFTARFGYVSARCHVDRTFTAAMYQRAIYANLDAGFPVVLGIEGTEIGGTATVGHEILADGYGYYNTTVYTHLNMGWAGLDDAWYALPTIYADGNGYNFTSISSIIYNVFPTKTGELITGRVLNAAGSPIVGATVAAVNGSTTVRGTTNAKGIWALHVPGGRTWAVTASAAGYVSASRSVSVSSSSSSTLGEVYSNSYNCYRDGTIGNSWGNDFTLTADLGKPNLYFDHCFLAPTHTTTTSANGAKKTTFEVGEEIYLYVGFANNGETDTQLPFSLRHEVLDSAGRVLDTWVYNEENNLSADSGREWAGALWEGLQGLAEGSYTYRCMVDVDGEILETSETDNVVTLNFQVRRGEQPLGTVMIEGSTSVSPGGSASYTCRAFLADGSEVVATPLWAIDSGDEWAELSAGGVLTAGVFDTAKSVVIRATCTRNGVTRSATKVVSIQAALALATALDNTALSFTTGGDATWFGQAATMHDGVDAARSGVIGMLGQTWMETRVTGPGTLSFWYCVSSEQNYDYLTCTTNGATWFSTSGEANGWQQATLELPGATSCTVRWTYRKDVSRDFGLDAAFVDQVQWTVYPTPAALVIGGATSLAAGTSIQLTCTARMSNGTTKTVTPQWSIVDGGAYAEIDAAGRLTARPSTVARRVTVAAEYTERGVSKSAQQIISITGVLPAPAAPVITRAGAGTADAAVLAWAAAEHATSYTVSRRASGEAQFTVRASGLTELAYEDRTAEPGVAYSYRVTAVNATGSTAGEPEEAHRVVSLVVDPLSLSFTAAGGSATVSVKSNAGWTHQCAGSWVSRSAANETLTVSASANVNEAVRSSVIVLVAGGNTTYPAVLEIGVSQEGRPHVDGEDELPNLTLGRVEYGDDDWPFYATDSTWGDAKRLLDAGESLYLRWGVDNAGLGVASGTMTTALEISTSDAELVYWSEESCDEFYLEPEASYEGGFTFTDDSFADLAPGVYDAYVLLNVNDDIEESDWLDNFGIFRFAVRDPVGLEEALDIEDLYFETDDDAWYGTAGIGVNGEDCAMTKLLGDGGTNVLATTVSGAGMLQFTYRVSTEEKYDVFSFEADGEVLLETSGIGEWRTVSYTFGEGEHEFRWIYGKDTSWAEGDDCVYLDRVVWQGAHSDEPPAWLSASDGYYTGYVMLEWGNDEQALGYVIERAEGENGAWEEIFNDAYPLWEFVLDETAMGGVDYRYRIRTVYADGLTDWSDVEWGWREADIRGDYLRTLPGTAGQDAVTIEANCTWSVSVDVDWIRLDKTAGELWEKVPYHVTANDTDEEREGTITVVFGAGTDREYEKSISIYQRPQVNYGRRLSLAEAANTTLSLVCSGDAPWVGQSRISHDGVGSIRSGDIGANATSRVETVVTSGGTLSFWWGTCSESEDRLIFSINGVPQHEISGWNWELEGDAAFTNVFNWAQVTVEIPAGGARLTWEYVKDYVGDECEDAGFIDEISWTPVARAVTPEDAWWEAHRNLLTRLGVTWENRRQAAAMQAPGNAGSSGKVNRDGSPRLVWQEYVAGTEPLDSASEFKARIEMVGGKPRIRWTPELTAAESARRNYMIWGKRRLDDPFWEPVADGCEENYGFFQVKVEMK